MAEVIICDGCESIKITPDKYVHNNKTYCSKECVPNPPFFSNYKPKLYFNV